MTYLRRHCYDKFWRCPGWAGGGWKYARVRRCEGGSLLVPGHWNRDRTAALPKDPWWRWRWHQCRECDVRAIPLITQWLDPTWLAWVIRRLPDRWEDWRDLRQHRRERKRYLREKGEW